MSLRPDQKSSSSDEELDFTSKNFNPMKALYSKKLEPGSQRKFDNVSSFMSQIRQAGNAFDVDLNKFAEQRRKKQNQETKPVDEEKFHVTAAGRRFLKEQAPVHRGKKAKLTRDIFSRMENARGPLALLKKFRSGRTRVKIYVRKEHGIRGSVTGYIEAFDKHFNIALVDCIEVWQRRKFAFSESRVPLLGEPEDCTALLASMGIKVPEISVKSVDRKHVKCMRKFSQLVIRGEEVVLVAEDKEEPKDPIDLIKL